jgi:zinc protease
MTLRLPARLTAVFLLILGSMTAFAQTKPAPAAATPPATIPAIPFTRFVLKNGLTVLVHEDHKAPIAAVNVWYHVGSKNEKVGKTGFAHLFEHLMFNGSENFRSDYFKAVEPAGATDLNGTTNEDRTNYFQNVPLPALDRILWLESDRMGHLLGAIDQKILDEQRGVVQNEKRQGENEPYGKAWITIAENTYPKGHPYSWSVIGSMEDLSAASLEDVKEWFRTYYGPNNAVIVVAGDVKPEDARQRVDKYFGDIPPGPPFARHDQWIARRAGVQRQTLQDRVPQERIHKVWNVPGFASNDSWTLDLVAEALAGGKTSRLYRRLVMKDQSATDVGYYMDRREIGSQVLLTADVQPGGNGKAVERAMDEELARFLESGPTPAELERLKTSRRSSFIRGIERIGGFGGKSDILAQGAVYAGDPAFVVSQVNRVMRLGAGEVRDVARRWLSDGQYVLVVQPYPELTAIPAGADRTRMPDTGAVPAVPFPSIERGTLSNGMNILLSRRTSIPVVRLSLLADAGYAADRTVRPGAASLSLDMLDEGTTTRTSEQIADELESLGAAIRADSDVDTSAVSLTALKDKLDPAIAIWADLILNPSFPQKDLDRIKSLTLATIQQEKAGPVTAALRILPQLVYGAGHAYATPLTGSGTEESVNAMTRADLVKFHREWFKPNHSTVYAVGDISLSELTQRLERVFAGWKPGEIPRKEIGAVAPRTGMDVYIVDRPGAEQSLVAVSQLVPPKNYGLELAYQAFLDAFGGAFGSRVNLNLREDKHWSYGAFSIAVDSRGDRLWFTLAPVQTDKTKESLAEVLKELREVTSSRPISSQELQEAKDRMTRTLAGRWETGSAVGGALREIVTYGLTDDYYTRFGPRVLGLTAEDLSKAVREVVKPGQQIVLVVGDRSKIEAGVRELGLGEIHYLDGDGKPLARR